MLKVIFYLFFSGIRAMGIHGDKSQAARSNTIKRFKSGDCKIMIATDVAARGLDISNVEYVINYDFPSDIENYVHRIGRTGRSDNKGTSMSIPLCCLFVNSITGTNAQKVYSSHICPKYPKEDALKFLFLNAIINAARFSCSLFLLNGPSGTKSSIISPPKAESAEMEMITYFQGRPEVTLFNK